MEMSGRRSVCEVLGIQKKKNKYNEMGREGEGKKEV